MKSIFFVMALSTSLIGAAILLWGIRMRHACTEEALGRVVDIYEYSDVGRTDQAPILEFRANGQSIRARAASIRSGYLPRKIPYTVGDSVKLYYDPEDPKHFWIPDYDVNVLGIIGLVALAVGLAFMLAVLLFF